MIQGTGSSVGKSLIVAGLARAFVNRGLTVAPFKPQNMSNNAAVCPGGGEIGRAQALQARAAKIAPSVHMNPVLLKPETTTGAQIILKGERLETLKARQYMKRRGDFLPVILESFTQLRKEHDLVIVEGAGSPAEINLRQGDIANMGFATAAGVPVVLVADIHRGGVIASIVGTLKVLCPSDARHIKGFIINNFHGDISLFDEGRAYLEKAIKRPGLGIVPHFAGAAELPAEDALELDRETPAGTGRTDRPVIAVLRLPRIANFDDLDPLRLEPGLDLAMIGPGQPVPAQTTVIIIPGSKSTIADLNFLRRQGWDIDIAAHIRRGGHVLGLCGGYQMLGRKIHDPGAIEGNPGSVPGLGHLDVETTLGTQKSTTLRTARHAATGAPVSGYEIHLGHTTGPDRTRPFALFDDSAGTTDGATAPGGRVCGTYLHGCFSTDQFRRAWLEALAIAPGSAGFDDTIEATLDALAAHLEQHLDLDAIYQIAGSTP